MGRAQLKEGAPIVGTKLETTEKLVASEVLELMDFIFALSPQGVFALIMSYL
jgi:hypothetical protein